jgi:hypothetical protein
MRTIRKVLMFMSFQLHEFPYPEYIRNKETNYGIHQNS